MGACPAPGPAGAACNLPGWYAAGSGAVAFSIHGFLALLLILVRLFGRGNSSRRLCFAQNDTAVVFGTCRLLDAVEWAQKGRKAAISRQALQLPLSSILRALSHLAARRCGHCKAVAASPL